MITGLDISSPCPSAFRLSEVPFKLSSKTECTNWGAYLNQHIKTKGPVTEKELSDPGLWDCVHNVVHTGIGDRTCPIPYLWCTLLACKVELVDTEGSYSSCTRVRFLS
jgi:hypothetical protein